MKDLSKLKDYFIVDLLKADKLLRYCIQEGADIRSGVDCKESLDDIEKELLTRSKEDLVFNLINYEKEMDSDD